jgi:RNA polymerase sigma-70 factor (ECF subfamily)
MAVPFTADFTLERTLLRHWIEKAKSGDAAAFERIFVLHERMVLRTAQRLLMNIEDAKDAAQEVFLRLHRNLPRIREDKDLAPWLYRMTVNICLDAKRRSKPNVPIDQTREACDLSLDPEQALRRGQERALLTAALHLLGDRERAAIVLRDLEGCSTAAVAEILGSSEGTVRSQISTGRAKIRKFVLERLGRPLTGGKSD